MSTLDNDLAMSETGIHLRTRFVRKHFAVLLFVATSSVAGSAQAMGCPSARINDVLSNPTVASAMDTAWSNSKEGTDEEHIEGFNIYQCYDPLAVDGIVYTTQIDWGNGGLTSITYPSNTQSSACRLVGNFHTHPGVGTSNPRSNDPYENDQPSPSDLATGLPGIIRYGLGPIAGEGRTTDITYGPEVNRTLTWLCDENDVVVEAPGIGASVSADDNGVDGTASGVAALGAMPVSYNDPHLITLDGVAYSFQAIGEFILANSELGNFSVQARQQQTGPVNSQVSVNSGFAFKVGIDEVAVAFNSSNDLQVFVNSREQSQQANIALPDGGQLSIGANAITVNWQDGSKAVVDVHTGFLNLSLLVAEVHKGKLSGLLGNFDDNPVNDMRTNLGVDISLTPQAGQLYGIFTNGWRVSDENSLFVYFDNEDTLFFTDRLFPGQRFTVDDLSANARDLATNTCMNAGITNVRLLNNCIVDVGATNNVDFAQSIMQVQIDLADKVDSIVELAVEGRIDIPDVICTGQPFVDVDGSPVPDVSGVFIGTLTNPDLGRNWDTRIEFEQCGPVVNGLFSLRTPDELSFNRRFEGEWRTGQLEMNLAFPYSYTLDVGQMACIDMVAQLTGDANQLQGSWSASNCASGGEIDVVRKVRE